MPLFQSAPEIDDKDKVSVSTSPPKERSSPAALIVNHDVEEAQAAAPNGSYDDHNGGNHSIASPPLRMATAASSDRDPEFPTNQRLLSTAFLTFISFAVIELVFSFVAGSKAMLGDSSAMIVDSITYLFNGFAERRKNSYHDPHDDSVDDVEADPVRAAYVRQRKKRKTILLYEIVPPMFSVSILFVITMLIIKSAVDVLRHKVHPSQNEPNIFLMMGFSVFNLLLDLVNVFCFARARHLAGYATKDEDSTVDENADGGCELAPSSSPATATKRPLCDAATLSTGAVTATDPMVIILHCEGGNYENRNGGALENQGKRSKEEVPIATVHGSSASGEDGESDDRDEHSDNSVFCADGDLHKVNIKQRSNLNMCSAYTHVFADTLRSIAVIIAAGLSMIFPEQIKPEAADSVAAIVVSFLILLTLMPLLQGIWRRGTKLRAILVEERSERPCD